MQMPLTINVGLSRKTSENYNSQGVSINLTAELDQSLLVRPDELQGAVSELYEQAEEALDRQAGDSGATQGTSGNGRGGNRYPERNGHTNSRSPRTATGRGGRSGDRNGSRGGGMTESQRRAIHAISERAGVDPVEEAQHEFGVDLERASIKQASRLIDHLKGLQTTNGSRR
jgi:hypothetical protein